MTNSQESEKAPAKAKSYDLDNTGDIWSLIKDEEEDQIKTYVSRHLQKLIKNSGLEKYQIVFLYDDYYSISTYHSNKIYEALTEGAEPDNVLMILLSDGGRIEPAYLISKTCKRLAKKKFAVSIPRKAKSAATLISLGADEIHMGLLSELGPIDPQINGFPALGLANALEKIAYLSSKFSNSSDMFAKYLTENLRIHDLGYYERLSESAVQYAERLLEGKAFTSGKTAAILADHFTNHYKDHSFVIDIDEALKLLSKNTVKEKTKEYELGNEMFKFLELVDLFSRISKKRTIRYVGSVENGLDFNDKK